MNIENNLKIINSACDNANLFTPNNTIEDTVDHIAIINEIIQEITNIENNNCIDIKLLLNITRNKHKLHAIVQKQKRKNNNITNKIINTCAQQQEDIYKQIECYCHHAQMYTECGLEIGSDEYWECSQNHIQEMTLIYEEIEKLPQNKTTQNLKQTNKKILQKINETKTRTNKKANAIKKIIANR